MDPTGDFTGQANACARGRPGYPGGLVDRLARRAGVRSGDAVADLGAGTGLLTAALVARGLRVTAVEPNAAMRAHAPRLAGVEWIGGTFERTGLADGSCRWLVAAQSLHWADPPRALPALRRALAPGCALTALWNNRCNDAEPTLAWTWAMIRDHVPDFDDSYRDRDWRAVLTSTGDFAGVEEDDQRHVVPMPAERFTALWESHHRLATIAGAERHAAILAALHARLRDRGIASVDVPYVCRAWTARRRD